MSQAMAARVEDHIEIAVEAQDGTKLNATADQLEALVGDLETTLDADDAEAA